MCMVGQTIPAASDQAFGQIGTMLAWCTWLAVGHSTPCGACRITVSQPRVCIRMSSFHHISQRPRARGASWLR